MMIETEIKIKSQSNKLIRERLTELKADKVSSVIQKDTYFDSPFGKLKEHDKCLRLRKETDFYGNLIRNILCFKGQKMPSEVKKRLEIESLVENEKNIGKIFNEIGYKPSLVFEKKREIWSFNSCEVCLDKLPVIGEYIEIEGDDEAKILSAIEELGLDCNKQEKKSYCALIDQSIPKPSENSCKQALLEKAGNISYSTKETSIVRIIHNPNSGDGFAASFILKLAEYFRKQNLKCEFSEIKDFTDIEYFIKDARKLNNCKLIAASGGDGTIREVIHNMQGSKIPLMILPGGTENLLAHELGCNKQIDTYIEMFEQQSIHPLDIARVNNRYFTSILGIGFDAEVVELFSKTRNGNITHGDYIWPVWRAFWAHEIPSFEVKVDGKDVFKGSGMLFIGNISRYATGIKILQNADFGDGLIDLCIFPCKSKSDILKYLTMIVLQIHTKSDDVIYKKCKNVEILPLNSDVITQIDGDPGPRLPLNIEVLPEAINVYFAVDKR